MKKFKIKDIVNFNHIVVGIVIIFLLMLAIKVVAGLFVSYPTDTSLSAEEVSTALMSADKVEIKRSYKSIFKTKYVVFADNTAVAIVEGKTLPVLGDTFSLTAPNGDLMGSIKMEIFHLAPQGQVYDKFSNQVFRYEKKILIPSANLKKEDCVFGTYKTRFFSLTDSITENERQTYTIKNSFVFDNFVIKNTSDSLLSYEDTILLVCANESTLKNNNSSSSSSKKNN